MCANRVCKKRYLMAVIVLLCGVVSAEEAAPKITITADGKGGFTFDTGVLRGTMCPGGKLQGLVSVTHIPSGTRLDGSMGILSYYRVFTTGKRYGTGAWDWPATAQRQSDVAVQVTAPATPDRPFDLTAVYQWSDPRTLDLETTVTARADVTGFESFLASYFDATFPSPYVYARRPRDPLHPGEIRYASLPFLLAERSYGDWLMFTRGAGPGVPRTIGDGRWKLEPNPVDWTVLPDLGAPLCLRRNPTNGLAVILMAPGEDCFAVATPYAGEAHHSLYLSLFGRDLKAGQTARAHTRFVITAGVSDEQVMQLYSYNYHLYLKELKELSRPRRPAEATDKR